MGEVVCGCTVPTDGAAWTVVQHAHSRKGGVCALHGCPILRGEPIVKICDGQPGHQTKCGQGPGIWVCVDCALAHASD